MHDVLFIICIYEDKLYKLLFLKVCFSVLYIAVSGVHIYIVQVNTMCLHML